MVNLGGYRIIDFVEITSKNAARMQLGASSGIKYILTINCVIIK